MTESISEERLAEFEWHARNTQGSWTPEPVLELITEIRRLKEEVERLREALETESVREYIRSLTWTDEATEYEKTLVGGNLLGFAAHVRLLTQESGEALGEQKVSRPHEEKRVGYEQTIQPTTLPLVPEKD